LVFDFRHLFGLSWWESLRSDMGETANLVDGLRLWPGSLFRAAWLTANPPVEADPDAGPSAQRLGWLGLDDKTMLLARLHNMKVKPGARVLGPELEPWRSDEDKFAEMVRLMTM
jgi:hypothetical protein